MKFCPNADARKITGEERVVRTILRLNRVHVAVAQRLDSIEAPVSAQHFRQQPRHHPNMAFGVLLIIKCVQVSSGYPRQILGVRKCAGVKIILLLENETTITKN